MTNFYRVNKFICVIQSVVLFVVHSVHSMVHFVVHSVHFMLHFVVHSVVQSIDHSFVYSFNHLIFKLTY